MALAFLWNCWITLAACCFCDDGDGGTGLFFFIVFSGTGGAGFGGLASGEDFMLMFIWTTSDFTAACAFVKTVVLSVSIVAFGLPFILAMTRCFASVIRS